MKFWVTDVQHTKISWDLKKIFIHQTNCLVKWKTTREVTQTLSTGKGEKKKRKRKKLRPTFLRWWQRDIAPQQKSADCFLSQKLEKIHPTNVRGLRSGGGGGGGWGGGRRTLHSTWRDDHLGQKCKQNSSRGSKSEKCNIPKTKTTESHFSRVSSLSHANKRSSYPTKNLKIANSEPMKLIIIYYFHHHLHHYEKNSMKFIPHPHHPGKHNPPF